MRINLERLKEILEQQRERDCKERGEQPSMCYGCFISLDTDKTEDFCEKCRNYDWTCRSYLKSLEIKKRLFS